MGFLRDVGRALRDAAVETINSKPEPKTMADALRYPVSPDAAEAINAQSIADNYTGASVYQSYTRTDMDTETVDAVVPWPCGFDFSRIERMTWTTYDNDTGDELNSRYRYALKGANLSKATADFADQCAKFAHLAKAYDKHLPQVDRFIAFLERHGVEDASLEVATPTKKGGPRKFPVSVSISSEENTRALHGASYTLYLSYREDGTIGKGSYIYWNDGIGHHVEFGDDILKRVSVAIPAQGSGWKLLYDFKS